MNLDLRLASIRSVLKIALISIQPRMVVMTYTTLRIGRKSIPHQIYLVTTVTLHRAPIFTDHAVGRLLIHQLQAQDAADCTKTLAFVVMPDHVHWLFQLGTTQPLHQVIKHVKGSSAREINRHLHRTGQLWQPAFHDHAVRSNQSLIEIARYVIMNPVRAGLVKRVADYALWDSVWIEK